MKIAIIGAGAMGCFVGSRLSESNGNKVYLLDINKEHIDAVNAKGLIVEDDSKSFVCNRVIGVTEAKDVGVADLAIVFVKSVFTRQAIKMNRDVFGENTLALTLQNGLGNGEIIAEEIGKDKVIIGTTAHGAVMQGPAKICHGGSGKTVIGSMEGKNSDRLMQIADVLNRAGLETQIADDAHGLVWDKLLVNVGINALTAITGLENGKLLHYPELEGLLERAVSEAQTVAEAKGIKLSFEDPINHAKEVCRATAINRSSMLQDITNGRPTEIDTINGAIVREGREEGIDTPVNQVLTDLIHFKEVFAEERRKNHVG